MLTNPSEEVITLTILIGSFIMALATVLILTDLFTKHVFKTSK